MSSNTPKFIFKIRKADTITKENLHDVAYDLLVISWLRTGKTYLAKGAEGIKVHLNYNLWKELPDTEKDEVNSFLSDFYTKVEYNSIIYEKHIIMEINSFLIRSSVKYVVNSRWAIANASNLYYMNLRPFYKELHEKGFIMYNKKHVLRELRRKQINLRKETRGGTNAKRETAKKN